MRKLLAAAIAASALSCGRPPEAPARGRIDWNSLRTVSSPSQFRPLEPLLERLTGEEPVPSDKVLFVDSEKLKGFCGEVSSYGGCYDYGTIAFDRPAGLSMWLHEQGHHYDKHLLSSRRKTWMQELEAFAFQYYVFEYIAKNYDRKFGLEGILDGVFRMDFMLRSDKAFDPYHCTDRHGCAKDAIVPLFSLGFRSFAGFWRYVHGASESRLLHDYEETKGRAGEGRKDISRILVGLEGPDTYFSPVQRFFGSIDFSGFENSGKTTQAGDDTAYFGQGRVVMHDKERREFTLICSTDKKPFEAELYYLDRYLAIDFDGGVNVRIANRPYHSGEDYELRDYPAEARRYLAVFHSAFGRFIDGMERKGITAEAEKARERVENVFAAAEPFLIDAEETAR